MARNPAVNRAVIDYANACKTPADTAKIKAARANLAAAKLEQFIAKTLADAPPISAEQRAKLARLLDGGR
jgi:hypothetical protein